MDPITGALVIFGLKYVGQPGAELVKDLVERILGPAADAKGLALREWIEQRHNRATDTLFEAGTLLRDAGIEPQPVPGRILLPLLEKASLQDQSELQRKWAALLANAATPDKMEILPAYVEILSQLLPLHASLLDGMFSRQELTEEGRIRFKSVSRDEVLENLNIDKTSYAVLAVDLHRMRLIEGSSHVWIAADPVGLTNPTNYGRITLTALGIHFIAACQPPARAESFRSPD